MLGRLVEATACLYSGGIVVTAATPGYGASRAQSAAARGLPASELLQAAVRAELRRQDLLSETDVYLTELVAEVGEPSAEEKARAEAIARQLAGRRAPRAE